MKSSQLLLALLVVVPAIPACDLKSIVSDIVAQKDGGPSDAGGSGVCNTLVNAAPVVSKTTNAGPTPAATGGTIADGTYFLTRMDKWNGITGANTHKETWVFSSGTIQVVTDNESDGGTKHASGTYATSGSTLTFTVTCPGAQTVSMPFTATATELTTINADDPNESHTYTKQ
jgi:hypothetical protein